MEQTIEKQRIFFPAGQRGRADFGWLQSRHSFSFGNYYDPDNMGFGALRVLNDDRIAPGAGFGMHPHDNMEIISIPLEGSLKHKDNMGNSSVISEGEVQVMSAGTGVMHSEFNPSRDQTGAFLQIWILPNAKNVTPRYDQQRYLERIIENGFTQLVRPLAEKSEGVGVHQNARIYLARLTKGSNKSFEIKNSDVGLFAFVLKGAARIDDQPLGPKDALGLVGVETVAISAPENAEILLIEVPMRP